MTNYIIRYARLLAVFALVLGLVLGPGGSAHAQDAGRVTLTFRVDTSGTVPGDATFFALVGPPYSEYLGHQLTDPDGDGTYMGSVEVTQGDELVIKLVQGAGTADGGQYPGEPSTDLKVVSTSDEPYVADEDAVISAQASFGGDDQQGDDVTLTFELTLNGDVPEGEGFVLEYPYPSGQSFGDDVFCGLGADAPACEGGGKVYRLSLRAQAGSTERFAFARITPAEGDSPEIFFDGSVTANAAKTVRAYYTFGGDDQQQDDDQDGNDQQQDETVTKTFKLTLNGTVPKNESFYVQYASDQTGLNRIAFCGDPEVFADAEPCVGGGAVYTTTAEIPRGATINFQFVRGTGNDTNAGRQDELFFKGTETLTADRTNSAYYAFAGAGDDQQGDDTEDGRVPDEMPRTGAGGLSGAVVPAGALAAAVTLLGAGVLGLLRRR
jgi:hypothetical protein